MKTVLAFDDNEINLQILDYILTKEGYKTKTTTNPQEVMAYCLDTAPNLILLDINMPELDGFTLCKMLKENEKTQNIPIIFVSAQSDSENLTNGFSYGAVDYITKPFKVEEVKARISTHIKLYDLQIALENHNKSLESLIEEQVKMISDAQMETIFSLAKLAQSRDDDTGKHLERVQEYCRALSEGLKTVPKYSEIMTDEYIDTIVKASMLHDIGKVGISDLILLKPGKLTDEEFEKIKTHTMIGFETLDDVSSKFGNNMFIETGKIIARNHHERWDGRGYPDKLQGEGIPLAARIMSIADVYDAISSKRIYKDAFTQEKCVEIIKDGAGTQFDPELVEVFLQVADEFNEIRTKLSD